MSRWTRERSSGPRSCFIAIVVESQCRKDARMGGGGAIICPGVKIGSKAVIGAGSVVTRDIPDGVFAAGNPCRIIREITE